MEAVPLQDWITIEGTDAIPSVPQSAHGWLELGWHEDLVFYLDVRRVAGADLKIQYETAPCRDERAFLAMIAPISPAVGVRTDRIFFATAAVPPARWVRWRLTAAGAGWGMTFRIWVAAYAFGR